MAHYIAYATRAGTARPREMLTQVHGMLAAGLWGVPSTALLKAKLMPGDGLIVAVGAPYRRFVGDAVLASGYRRLTDEEVAGLPDGLEYDHGIALTRARIWPHGRLIAELWPGTMAARNNRDARFFGAITSVRSVDAALIVAAGVVEAQRRVDERRADTPCDVVVADHADTREPASARAHRAAERGHLTDTPSDSVTHAERLPPVLEPSVLIDLATRALEAAERSPAGLPAGVAHADWGSAAAKRVAATAELHDGVYRARPPVPVRDADGLIERMGVRPQSGKSVLLGFDFPIGVPCAYARLVGFDNFANWFRELDLGSPFFEVAADLAQVSAARPFFPTQIAEKTPGVKARFHGALGLSDSDMLRWTDRAHCGRRAASEMFWTLGAQAVGKATLAGWKHAIRPALAEPERTYSIWPFDGPLTELLRRSDAVIVETYPTEAYGLLGLRMGSPGTAKTSQVDRRQDARRILECCAENAVIPDQELAAQVLDGFGATRAGEDLFDAVVGLLGMIQTLRRSPEPELPNDSTVRNLEGWMFGQHADCPNPLAGRQHRSDRG